MKRISGLPGKEECGHRQRVRCVFFAGLLACVLSLALWTSAAFSAPVFAAPFHPSQNVFTVSPTQGPVDAVITISATGVTLTDGTQVSLGYTTNLQTCTIVAGGQSAVVQGSAFSGWFRWPSTTGIGTFGVCAIANNAPFQVGSYQVLAASAPRIALAPTKLSAGEQATVSGSNFLPSGTSVNLLWRPAKGGRSMSLGTVSSDATGAFSHTFTVPARASTNSYTVTATVGGGSPPVLSATTTFHVDGVTLVAVPTPTTAPVATAMPTLAPTVAPAATTPQIVPTRLPANTDAGGLGNKASLFVPIAVGSGLLIVLALVAGVVVVRRQRKLVTASSASSSTLLWPEAADTLVVGGANAGVGAFTPYADTMYPGPGAPPANAGGEYSPVPEPTAPEAARRMTPAIPFDPGLAEAMREAQVSLFATPRPPVSEEVEIQ